MCKNFDIRIDMCLCRCDVLQKQKILELPEDGLYESRSAQELKNDQLTKSALINDKLRATFPQAYSKANYEGALVKTSDYLFGKL